MSTIEVKNLCKYWGDNAAVDDISFIVPSGSFTVLLGPSGCGKSTTLRLIAGLENASSGSVFINTKDVSHLAADKRDLSMVFQSYALFPHLSVAENIIFGLRVRRVARDECKVRLNKTAELLGLSDLLQRKPAEISGGQQQRVALGRAIIAEKPICLMDEPLSNLDAKLRHEMRLEIRKLQQSLGITMVYVTHDQTEAISMADQVVLMNKGKIEQIANPDEIYTQPATQFSASFIGTPPMNLLPLEKQFISGTSFAVTAPCSGEPLNMGLRPEDISISESGGYRATVSAVEYLGADTLVECCIGSHNILARGNGTTRPTIGEIVRLEWSEQSQHFFYQNNGLRLPQADKDSPENYISKTRKSPDNDDKQTTNKEKVSCNF